MQHQKENAMDEKTAASNKLFRNEFLAVGRKRPTEAEWNRARAHAENWDTCASGTTNDGIPRVGGTVEDKNEPLDGDLQGLGCIFMNAIIHRDLDLARDVSNRIQLREAIVLSELK